MTTTGASHLATPKAEASRFSLRVLQNSRIRTTTICSCKSGWLNVKGSEQIWLIRNMPKNKLNYIGEVGVEKLYTI